MYILKFLKATLLKIVAILACLFITACNTSGGNPNADVSILFIGNSYTFYNQMPKTVYEMAKSAREDIYFKTSVRPGADLNFHANNKATIDAINSRPWTYVILQNHSLVPSKKPEDVRKNSLPDVRVLADVIKANSQDSEIVFFQTWGRLKGDKINENTYPLVGSFDGHTAALRQGYEIYREAVGGTIAPVGDAWKDAFYAADIPFNKSGLWQADKSHPTNKGSYLVALTFFKTLFEQPVLDVTYNAKLKNSDAQWLRNRVDNFSR